MSRFLLVLSFSLAGAPLVFPQPPPAAALTISFDDALKRARAISPELISADIATRLAGEDRLQAKAALLPSLSMLNQFIYTQPNGRDSGVFVANNGPREYLNQAVVHGELFSPVKLAEYRMSLAAAAEARARREIAARGLTAVVTSSYYAMAAAQRRSGNARQSLKEADHFLDITQKQERGGEVAHADVVKAEIQREQRQRETQEAALALEKAQVELAVLIFRDFRQDFSVVDDLESTPPLPSFEQVQAQGSKGNPAIRAAEQAVQRETYGVKAARAALLPTFSFDYFFGIDANQFAIHDPEHRRNLGSSVLAELSVPIWNWGAAQSQVRQARLRLQQTQTELSFAQRELLAGLRAFYLEAEAASSQLISLRRSLDLATESLRLTLLGYQAGEAAALEVVDAQTTLVEARNAVADGLLRYRLGVANLQTLTGAF